MKIVEGGYVKKERNLADYRQTELLSKTVEPDFPVAQGQRLTQKGASPCN